MRADEDEQLLEEVFLTDFLLHFYTDTRIDIRPDTGQLNRVLSRLQSFTNHSDAQLYFFSERNLYTPKLSARTAHIKAHTTNMAASLARCKGVEEMMRDSLKGASEAEINAAIADFMAQDSPALETTRRRASNKPNTSASFHDTAFEDLGTDVVKTTKHASRAGKVVTSRITKRPSGDRAATAKQRVNSRKPKIEDSTLAPIAVPEDNEPTLPDQQASGAEAEHSLDVSGLPQQQGDESELSTLGSTPKPPIFLTNSLSSALLPHDELGATTEQSSKGPPLSSDPTDSSPADSAFEAPVDVPIKPKLDTASVPSSGKIVCLKVPSPTTVATSPAASLSAQPSTDSSRPSRVKTKPRRFGELISTGANVVDEDLTLNAEQEEAPTDETRAPQSPRRPASHVREPRSLLADSRCLLTRFRAKISRMMCLSSPKVVSAKLKLPNLRLRRDRISGGPG